MNPGITAIGELPTGAEIGTTQKRTQKKPKVSVSNRDPIPDWLLNE